MKSKDPTLEKWIKYGNCLVGYVFGDKRFKPGTRILTDFIRHIDYANLQAETKEEKFRLGEPGTCEEHDKPLKYGVWKPPGFYFSIGQLFKTQ